jgi:hypothetical protein
MGFLAFIILGVLYAWAYDKLDQRKRKKKEPETGPWIYKAHHQQQYIRDPTLTYERYP